MSDDELQEYTVTDESGAESSFLLSKADAEARGAKAVSAPKNKQAPAPKNKQAPAPEQK